MGDRYDVLKLNNQLCFPLYASTRATSKYYRRYMDEMGLTYTQYLAMLVIWEHKQVNLKTLGEQLYLDSGTLTPVLKRLEEKGYISRNRRVSDERNLTICITEAGEELKDAVLDIYQRMESWRPLSPEKSQQLVELLNEAISNYEEKFLEMD